VPQRLRLPAVLVAALVVAEAAVLLLRPQLGQHHPRLRTNPVQFGAPYRDQGVDGHIRARRQQSRRVVRGTGEQA